MRASPVAKVRYITLTQGFRTVVDDEDYERFSRLSWYVSGPSLSGVRYAVHALPRWPYTVSLHREILEMPSNKTFRPYDVLVHHINGDGLDNRRANLAVVTRSQHSRLHAKSSADHTAERKGD